MISLSELNFERFKWGGVRHDQPLYAALDLELFSSFGACQPTHDDVATLRQLLQVIQDVPGTTTAADLQKHLSPVLRSNKAERDISIGLLGLCGVMATREHPGHYPAFVAYSNRQLPARCFVDMAYPACWWRGDDGLNEQAIDFWFGHLL